MSKVPDLQIEVQEALRRIIVKTPGTAYETMFGLMPRGLCFLSGFGPDDRKARITSQEFTVMAKGTGLAYRRETPTGVGRQGTNKAAVRVPCRVFVTVPRMGWGYSIYSTVCPGPPPPSVSR